MLTWYATSSNKRELTMPRKFDRIGCVYGRLTVVAQAGNNAHKQRLWECQCECGNSTIVTGGALTTGNTASCGCYLKERITKHGGCKKGSYNTWRAMMRRCYNPKDKDFNKYGAVGVEVQKSWHEYAAFAADIGEPKGKDTLHRIDPYGDYTKENCEWASPTRQAREIRLPKRNKTGHVGVKLTPSNKYIAVISVKGKKYTCKVRSSIEEAIADRRALETAHWT